MNVFDRYLLKISEKLPHLYGIALLDAQALIIAEYYRENAPLQVQSVVLEAASLLIEIKDRRTLNRELGSLKEMAIKGKEVFGIARAMPGETILVFVFPSTYEGKALSLVETSFWEGK